MIGTSLSHFRITAKLGEGGMGEVWQAEDTRLGREVAIKLLPAEVAGDPERLARFEREAQVLASLNHTSIAGIHQVEEADGRYFLVLELAPGETLEERIARGPLPLEEVCRIGLQLADALAAAHERGIVHRDLKPANVKLSETGEVKVLDFGLAKALAPSSGTGGRERLSISPTLTAQMTQAGVLLGTAGYMSPEQARGQEADERSDLWAFGVILHEMLTGRRLFAGDTVSDILAAVLTSEPDWEELPVSTPRPIRRLLRRCLERDPGRRLHDVRDARLELEDAVAGRGVAAAEAAPPAAARWWRSPVPWVLIAGLAAGVGWLALGDGKPIGQLPLRKLLVAEIEPVSLFFTHSDARISPDGLKVAYLSEGKLLVRRLDELEPREVPGSNFESVPIWSPDSRWVAFPEGLNLWKAPVAGGEARPIAKLPTNVGFFGGGWGADDRIVLTTGYSGLLEVSAQGGALSTLLAPDPDTESDFHDASLLPGGRGVLFVIHYQGRTESPIALWDGTRRQILLDAEGTSFVDPVYSNTGHILFHRAPISPGLWAVPFSLDSLEVIGEPFLVERNGYTPSVAADGTLVYLRGGEQEMRRLVWVDRAGKEAEEVGIPQRGLEDPSLAPGRDRVALTAIDSGSRDVWVQDLTLGTRTQVSLSSDLSGPAWSPDGRRLAYYTGRSEPMIQISTLDGKPVEIGPGARPDWSADGRYLVFERFGGRGLWAYELEEGEPSGQAQLLLDLNGDESEPVVSPDGSLLAYSSDETGRFQVYLTRFPSGRGRWQVSSGGGYRPRWSPEGDELFFIGEQAHLWAAKIGGGDDPREGAAQRLFDGRRYGFGESRNFVPGPGGERILVVRSEEERQRSELLLVQNWTAEFDGQR